MKVKLHTYVRHNGVSYKPGGTIIGVTEKDANRLKENGSAEIIGQETKEELAGLKIDQLRKLAEEKEIDDFDKMKKTDLVAALVGEPIVDSNSGNDDQKPPNDGNSGSGTPAKEGDDDTLNGGVE